MNYNLFVSGGNGFVGRNLIRYLEGNFEIHRISNFDNIHLYDYVIHLAGKAHDLKTTSIPSVYYHVNTELTQKVFDAFLYRFTFHFSDSSFLFTLLRLILASFSDLASRIELSLL
jgi:nucleoside-diphosphate-sugar epimerase